MRSIIYSRIGKNIEMKMKIVEFIADNALYYTVD